MPKIDFKVSIMDVIRTAAVVIGAAFWFGAGTSSQTTQNSTLNKASDVNAAAIIQLTNVANELKIQIAALSQHVQDLDEQMKQARQRYQPPPQARVQAPQSPMQVAKDRPQDLAGWVARGAHKLKDAFTPKADNP